MGGQCQILVSDLLLMRWIQSAKLTKTVIDARGMFMEIHVLENKLNILMDIEAIQLCVMIDRTVVKEHSVNAMQCLQHNKNTDSYQDKYHTFYSSQNGGAAWDARENCPRGGGAQRSTYQPQCCTNSESTSPFVLYNAAIRVCCPNGKTALPDRC